MWQDDRLRLQQMADGAKSARRFMEGKTRQDLENDQMLAFAVVKAIEIIGVAAGKVSVKLQEQCGEIPWENVKRMGERLEHPYFDIDLDTVWITVNEELSVLQDAVVKVIKVRFPESAAEVKKA